MCSSGKAFPAGRDHTGNAASHSAPVCAWNIRSLLPVQESQYYSCLTHLGGLLQSGRQEEDHRSVGQEHRAECETNVIRIPCAVAVSLLGFDVLCRFRATVLLWTLTEDHHAVFTA